MPRGCDEEEWFSGVDASHTIEVTVTDNPVIGVIYGPDGDVLVTIHERPTTFGFVAGRRFGTESESHP